jgi:hypothetical protein
MRFHKVTTSLCTKEEGSQVSEQHRNCSSHQRLCTRVETTEYIKQISNCEVSRYLTAKRLGMYDHFFKKYLLVHECGDFSC